MPITLATDQRFGLLRYPSAFNHSRKRNRAAAAATNFPADSALVNTLWLDFELCAVLIAEIKQRIPDMRIEEVLATLP